MNGCEGMEWPVLSLYAAVVLGIVVGYALAALMSMAKGGK
jgi:hypothetical protein